MKIFQIGMTFLSLLLFEELPTTIILCISLCISNDGFIVGLL